MRSFNLLVSLLAGSELVSVACAKNVFAHYMIGTTDADHAQKDVQDAIAIGLDAFAMNVGNPTASWAQSCVKELFDAAQGTNFSLFFSFDMYQDSTLSDHVSLFKQYQDHANYMRAGPNNYPVISSYGGYSAVSDWASFKKSSNIYLIPNLDDSAAGSGDTSSYYTDPSGELSKFNSIVDGYFSWESAWPASTGGPTNVSSTGDANVLEFAHGASKSYMMGLSTLQYKDTSDGSWYRIGEANFPQRMTEILDLKPDFTEVITWNDGGESHYIGNLWEEGYTSSPEILEYANTQDWPHYDWQPLVTSFIKAFKAGKGAGQMSPPSSDPIGAMWYRGMLKSCSQNVPKNTEAALDTVNYAIVVPSSSQGMKVRVSSGNTTLSVTSAKPGLNYAAVDGMVVGQQKVELLSSSGAVVMSATSRSDVTNSDKCNFNFNVVGLSKTSSGTRRRRNF
ncbi:uncharacterized protein N7459_009659 [Penicillium hispanicum]|uniref:uncharacterized protein n=1 Tax=Penicillium hispanicum TaxID=1080232 RepID=UPI0025402C1F|nr:uncharacterized protein N7459_009659 [Penicillium hispanicum]KAJ5570229.1 hypothetical protein N7459_009659 [Penicillium hispanicum]